MGQMCTLRFSLFFPPFCVTDLKVEIYEPADTFDFSEATTLIYVISDCVPLPR